MHEGPIFPLLLRLALPMFIAQLVTILYNITDAFWVGRINLQDPGIVGGVGLVVPIIFLAMAISQGILAGMSSIVARAIGEKDDSIISKVAESGLVIALVATALFTVPIYIWSHEIITLLGGTGSYYTSAHTYMIWVLPTAGIAFLTSSLNGILQGEGLMKQVMISLLLGPIVNLFLDPLLIFGFNMGLEGAAIATVIGHLLGLGYAISVFLRKIPYVGTKWDIREATVPIVRKISTIGMPQFLSFVIMAFAIFVINRIVITLDPHAMTATQLWQKIDQIIFSPIIAISSALIPAIGQNAGQGNITRIIKLWRTGVIFAASVFLVLATVVFIFAPIIFPLFTNVDSVIEYAVRQTRIIEFTALAACAGILARAVFQALGEVWPSIILSLLRLIILVLPFIYLYVYIFDMGVPGVWYGMITGNIITGITSFFWMEWHLKEIKLGKKQFRRAAE